ncbi:diguanylate cyclase [Scytonema sp. UIC 10036]|uniref:diguanylate cyclase n=1 Tax=Scytonema sp. UIC 10036 TaxID=2304196 RepID=UPI0012DA5E31|nr:diguanylate cyclase [Scytonema sp. UIC 10036]MUG98354.1 diguanylate cyclase [Scytonema sp. UIC 10036]
MFSPKILVIEDEEIFALALRQKLQELGYTVSEITHSGEEALHTRDLQIAIEIAIRKHYAERTLQAEQQKFTAILKSMGCAVIITDIHGCVQMINPLAEVLTACSQHEATNKELTNIFRFADKEIREGIENLTIQVLQKGISLNLPKNCILYTKDSREIHIEGSITPICDDNGHIKGAVLVFQDITQRKQVEADLIRNAFYDTLTGLPNRALFLERLGQAFERSQRSNDYNFAVLFLDLDGFKTINDRLGHCAGDRLLIETARRLESSLRSGDTVGRFGGDEFVILVEDIKDVADAINVAQRIQNSLKLPVSINSHQLFVEGSIGIALNCCTYQEPFSLLRDADIAMYRAKAQGKARYAVFDFPQLLVTND